MVYLTLHKENEGNKKNWHFIVLQSENNLTLRLYGDNKMPMRYPNNCRKLYQLKNKIKKRHFFIKGVWCWLYHIILAKIFQNKAPLRFIL